MAGMFTERKKYTYHNTNRDDWNNWRKLWGGESLKPTRQPPNNSVHYRCIPYLRIFSTRVVRRIISWSAARATTPELLSSAC